MNARNQYLKDLRHEYLQSSKQQKTILLAEAHKRTRLCPKYLIVKLAAQTDLRPHIRKKRTCYYDGLIMPALLKLWKIFDYPCGQRLKSIIVSEIDNLRRLGEIHCSNETADKLKKISSSTLDTKLKRERYILHLNRYRSSKRNPLLFQQIPIKVNNDLDHTKPGCRQVDYVEHCGASNAGQYIHTLATVDIYSDWWDARAIMPKSQEQTHIALNDIKNTTPIDIKELHADNDHSILNALVSRWAKEQDIVFSRSRPYKKNDNAHIEQKNRTHVRNVIGHRRYDTRKELTIINSLYPILGLYKNFFQPIMRLQSKLRDGSKVHRKYAQALTPYQRLINSPDVSKHTKDILLKKYCTLNPAHLKRIINIKTKELYDAYHAKQPKK